MVIVTTSVPCTGIMHISVTCVGEVKKHGGSVMPVHRAVMLIVSIHVQMFVLSVRKRSVKVAFIPCETKRAKLF